MSSFKCEFCGKEIIESHGVYKTECPHYPYEPKNEASTSLEDGRMSIVLNEMVKKRKDK
jgi:hypothetical protein